MRRRYPHLLVVAAVALILIGAGVSVGAATATAKSEVGQASGASGLSPTPLSPAFLRWQADYPLGTMEWGISGLGLGEVPSPLDLSYARGTHVRAASDLLYPASYDLRTLGRVTSVKDQGTGNTCWAFATMASLESCLLPGEADDFSEDNLVLTDDFDWFNAATPAQLYDEGGNSTMAMAYLVRWSGPVLEADDPYGDGLTPTALTVRKHVQDVSMIPARASATDNSNVKWLVMTYGAIAASMYMNDSSANYNSTTHAYYYNGTTGSNHGVDIVGWDDNYPAANFATEPPGNGAFIVRNSWGTSWGDGGYCYVSYYDSMLGRDSPMLVYDGAQPTTNYSRIYQYDPLGWLGTFNAGQSATGWMANVFTAQASASLSAVGFYAVGLNMSYEVWAGSSLTTLTQRTSGTLATMGYHTVSLPTPMAVAGGQPFVVAVKLTMTGGNNPIPIDYAISGYSDGATARVGRSYYSSNGANWQDLAVNCSPPANACLKAYTTGDPATPNHEIPGLPLPGSPLSGTLAAGSAADDVYSIHLQAGDTLAASISASAGTNFDLYLFPPSQVTVAGHSGAVAAAISTSYPDSFTYTAAAAGTFSLDAFASSGAGSYTIAYTVTPAPSDDFIPGLAIPASPFTGTIDWISDAHDVYRLHLDPGQTLTASVTGTAGTRVFLSLYPPGTATLFAGRDVNGAYSDTFPNGFAYTATEGGDFYLDVWGFSGSGSYTVSYTISSTTDTTPPTTSVSGLSSGWVNHPVTLIFTASDDGSGVAATQYRLNTGAWTQGSSVTISSPGTTTVAYGSVDKAGNIEAAKSVHVCIDTGRPSATASKNVTVKQGKKAKLAFRLSDPAPSCGAAHVMITIRSKTKIVKTINLANVPTNTTQSCSLKASFKKGSYTWTVKAADIAGNVGKAGAARKLIVK